MIGRSSLLFLLSLGCEERAANSPKADVATVETTTATPARTADPAREALPACDDPDVEFHLDGLAQERVLSRFGPPTEREAYRAADVGGESYVAIEHRYPSADPKNGDVPIEEWTWHAGDCRLTVWFHDPKGSWEVLDDAYYDRRTQF